MRHSKRCFLTSKSNKSSVIGWGTKKFPKMYVRLEFRYDLTDFSELQCVQNTAKQRVSEDMRC